MKYTYRLEGLDCANCAAKIEKAVGKLSGVREATLSFITQKLYIDADEIAMPEIILQTEKIIKKLEPDVTVKRF
ncbi:MAG: cation transporter [Clostridia bacterium]|nr:cation transporter [Clostridia bacterium]